MAIIEINKEAAAKTTYYDGVYTQQRDSEQPIQYPFIICEMVDGNTDFTPIEVVWCDGEVPENSEQIEQTILKEFESR